MKSSVEERKKARRMSISNRELLLASSSSDLEQVELLVTEGADVNFRDRDGNTPLHLAAESGYPAVVELLLNKGAIVTIENNQKETAVDVAKRLNKQDIIQILEASSDTKPHTKQPQNKKLSDKQLIRKPGQVAQLSGKNVNHLQQTQFIQTGDSNNKDGQNKQANVVHENIYQLKVLMLFLYRGISRNYSFRIGSEIKEAKKFTDLVFEYTQGNEKVNRLLQTKHKLDESKKITGENLLKESDGDFSLIKYFFSYQHLKNEKLFKDGSIKNITICTNINLDFKYLKSAQIKYKKIEDKDDILDLQYDQKQPVRYKLSGKVVPLLKQKLRSCDQARQAGIAEYSDAEIKDFLDHLVFAVNQPNEEELSNIVKKEIGEEFNFITTEKVYNKFFITMLNWLQGKERHSFFSHKEGKELFEEARRGIPIFFGVRDPVESFIGRTEQLDNLHKILQGEGKTAISQLVSISGPGGVGKSEIVRKYICEHSHSYDEKVVWINAESYQSLVKSFCSLAYDKLKISTKDVNGEEKEIGSIVKDVYTFFSNGRSLFIFDNAEKYKSKNELDHGIDKFLPSLPPNFKRPCILVISRNQKWPEDIKILPIDVFNEEEAIEFIEKSFNIENGTQKENIKELVKKLQLFPLALQHAVAYIKFQDEKLRNIGSEFKVNNYLERFREKTREVPNFIFSEDSDINYKKTLIGTWNVTLDAINQKKGGNDALEILNIVSYLISENIPAEMFLNLLSNEKKLGSAIELLKQYSMVNFENGMLSIHRLVQQVTRIHLKKQNTEEKILRKALKLFEINNVGPKNINHVLSVWNYSSKYREIAKEFVPISWIISRELIHSARYGEAHLLLFEVSSLLSEMPLDNPGILIGFLETKNHIASTLLIQGKYDTALINFEDIFNTYKSILGQDHPKTLSIKDCIAFTLFKKDKYNEALKYYQEILSVYKITLGENHRDTLKTKHLIAEIFLHQGRDYQALEVFQEICKIQEVTLGKVHTETLDTKERIAHTLLNLSNYDKALEVFQEINNIQENTLKTNDPIFLIRKRTIAGILCNQCKYTSALKVYQEVFNSQKVLLGENHPHVLSTYLHLTNPLRLLGKYDKALEIIQEIYAKQKSILGSDHPDSLRTHETKALIFEDQEKYTDALHIYQKVLSRRKLVLGENHIDTLNTKNNIGQALFSKMQYDQALQIFQEVYNKSKEFFPGHPLTFIAKRNITNILANQSKYNEALNILKKDIDSQEASLGKEHHGIINTRIGIAEMLILEGKHNEALRIFQGVNNIIYKVFGPEHPKFLNLSLTIESLEAAANDLLDAVKNNLFEKIEFLVKIGGDTNTKDKDNKTLLHYSVNNCNINIVNILLKNGADVNEITNNGNTPLHIATSKGCKEIVQVLLENVNHEKLNDFINARTTFGENTSLHVAAKSGFLEIVELLLKYGAIYDIENRESKTPLDISKNQKVTDLLKLVAELFEDVRKGNLGVFSKLKAVKSEKFLAVTNARNKQGNTLLQIAIANKHKSISCKLIEMLKDPEKILSWPLEWELDQLEKLKSAAELHIHFSKLYLPLLRSMSYDEKTYDGSEKNTFPWSTLKEGSYYLGNVFDLVEVHKECRPSSIDNKSIQTVIDILADLEFDPKHITTGYTDEAYNRKTECFVSKGQGTKYYKLLHSELKKDVRCFIEIVERNIDIPVKMFLASINERLHFVFSEKLFEAVKNDNCLEVENLSGKGVTVKVKDPEGRTPLHYAVNNGNMDIMNILLKNGADVTEITIKGNTPLHTATSKGYKEIVQALLQNVNHDKLNDFINARTTSSGNTSLHVATKSGFLEIVESLLKYGATYDIENRENKTPLDLSKDQKVTNLLKLVAELFEDARNGNLGVINKLKAVKSEEFFVVTNARNKQGNTLLQTAIVHKNIESKLIEMLKEPDQN